MKSILITIAVFAIFALCIADDNGQYQPEKYGDDGKYHPARDGQYYDRYRNLYGRDLFYRYNPYYTQQYYKNYSPYQQLLTPFVDYRTSIDQEASSLTSVTSRPPTIVSTARPIIYATPSTIVPIYRNQYNNEGYARIVNQENDANENSYHYKYLTENGISAEENGVVDPVNGGGTRTSGFYEYVGDDGVKYRVDYTADENGFRPTGAHLP